MVVFAMIGKIPLGSTCLIRMEKRLSPIAMQLRMKVRSRMALACARISLALPTHEVSPMTIMTLYMELPKVAMINRMRKKVGSIRKMFMTSLSILSAMPP